MKFNCMAPISDSRWWLRNGRRHHNSHCRLNDHKNSRKRTTKNVSFNVKIYRLSLGDSLCYRTEDCDVKDTKENEEQFHFFKIQTLQ